MKIISARSFSNSSTFMNEYELVVRFSYDPLDNKHGQINYELLGKEFAIEMEKIVRETQKKC